MEMFLLIMHEVNLDSDEDFFPSMYYAGVFNTQEDALFAMDVEEYSKSVTYYGMTIPVKVGELEDWGSKVKAYKEYVAE